MERLILLQLVYATAKDPQKLMIVHVIINVVMMMDHAHVYLDIQPLIAIHVILDIMFQIQFPMKIHAQV